MCKFILRISFTLLKSLTFCWRLLRSLFQLDSRSCCSSSRCSSFIWRKSCSFYCCVCDFFILSIASSYSFLLSFICCSSCWRCCFPCFTACCSTAFSVWSLFSTATFRGQLLFVWDLGSSGCVSWFGPHSDPSSFNELISSSAAQAAYWEHQFARYLFPVVAASLARVDLLVGLPRFFLDLVLLICQLLFLLLQVFRNCSARLSRASTGSLFASSCCCFSCSIWFFCFWSSSIFWVFCSFSFLSWSRSPSRLDFVSVCFFVCSSLLSFQRLLVRVLLLPNTL